MTPNERRAILADMITEEVKRVMRATSRRIGDGATKEQLIRDALAAAEMALHKSGASDMLPVALDLHADPKHPTDPKKVLVELRGPLFEEPKP